MQKNFPLIFILLSFILTSCSTLNKVKKDLPKVVAPEEEFEAFRVAWVKNLDPVYNTGNLPIGTSAPFIFDDILYMGDLSGNMTAYDLDSGRPLWSHKEKHAIQARVNKVGDYIFYGTRYGRFFSRHYLTGKLKYSTDLGAPIESQPVFSDGRLIIHLRNHTIVTLDAETGKVFWRYRRSIPYTTTLQRVSQVLPYQNKVVVGFADGSVVALSLSEGVVVWEQRISTGLKFVDVDVKPAYFNGKIVAGSAAGPIRFLSPQSGAITRTIEIFQSSRPVIEGNAMVVGSVYGEVAKVDKSGKVVFKKKISDSGISSIKPWKNGYVVTTMGPDIYFLNKDTFEPLDHFDLGSEQSAVFGSIAKGQESISVYSSRNRLYVFR